MIRWDYQIATEENGMFNWEDGSGNDRSLALGSGLRLLGSQGFELVTTIERRQMGKHTTHTLIFKRPSEA